MYTSNLLAQDGGSAQGTLTLLLLFLGFILYKIPKGFWTYLGKKKKKPRLPKKEAPKQPSNLPADLVPYELKKTVGAPPMPTSPPTVQPRAFEPPTETNTDGSFPFIDAQLWDAMCKKRKLGGLSFIQYEETPFGKDVHVKFGGSLSFPYVQANLDQIKTGLNMPHDWRIQLKKGPSSAFGIVRVITHDPLSEPIVWQPRTDTVRLADPLWLSRNAYGEDIHITAKRRIGIFGTSGAGKSCTYRLIAAHVIQAVDADLEVWDMKFGLESQHFEGKAHRVTTVQDAVGRVKWLMEDEYPRRASLMREWRTSTWDETREHKARVIILDEGDEVVNGFKTTDFKTLASAIKMGRALGVYFVWATQYPKAENLPTEIRSQLDCRISLLLLSSEESRVVYKDEVDDGWAPHLLIGPGWMFIKDTDHRAPEESKALWLDKDTISSIPLSGTVSSQEAEPRNIAEDSSVTDDIWTVLVTSDEPLGISDLARRTGRAKSAIHGALRRMEDSGTVCRTGTEARPQWCLRLSPEDT